MMYLDEEIAKMQKATRNIKKYKTEDDEEVSREEALDDLTQEEVTEAIRNGRLERLDTVFEFEKRSFLSDQVTLPIMIDFFEEEQDNAYDITLQKGNDLSIHLSSVKANGKDMPLIQFKLELIKAYKKQGIYVSFLEDEEKKMPNYTQKMISFKMASALGYIYHYQVFFNNKQVTLGISFNCLDEERLLWEKVIKGMVELIEINW